MSLKRKAEDELLSSKTKHKQLSTETTSKKESLEKIKLLLNKYENESSQLYCDEMKKSSDKENELTQKISELEKTLSKIKNELEQVQRDQREVEQKRKNHYWSEKMFLRIVKSLLENGIVIVYDDEDWVFEEKFVNFIRKFMPDTIYNKIHVKKTQGQALRYGESVRIGRESGETEWDDDASYYVGGYGKMNNIDVEKLFVGEKEESLEQIMKDGDFEEHELGSEGRVYGITNREDIVIMSVDHKNIKLDQNIDEEPEDPNFCPLNVEDGWVHIQQKNENEKSEM